MINTDSGYYRLGSDPKKLSWWNPPHATLELESKQFTLTDESSGPYPSRIAVPYGAIQDVSLTRLGKLWKKIATILGALTLAMAFSVGRALRRPNVGIEDFAIDVDSWGDLILPVLLTIVLAVIVGTLVYESTRKWVMVQATSESGQSIGLAFRPGELSAEYLAERLNVHRGLRS